jgi:hypothetical protein
MDTNATKGQKVPKGPKLSRDKAPHLYWWCAILCVLVCGCGLLKPDHSKQTVESPASAQVTQSSDEPVASPPPETPTSVTPIDPTPQPQAIRTAITDPPPAPALNPLPMAQPTKSTQNLVLAGAPAKVQTKHSITGSVAKLPAPQTTVTYMPREAAAAIVIKGPPRPPPEPSWSRIAAPLCLGIAMGAMVVALVFRAKQHVGMPSGRKAHKDGLFLPTEFKLRDSAFQPGIPFGMLAPENRVRRSKMELMGSLFANTTNTIRSIARKLSMEREGAPCPVVRQRVSVPLPMLSSQCSSSSKLVPPEAPDSKSAEISPATPPQDQDAPAENGTQGKPTESPPSANPDIAEIKPLEAPTLESITTSKVAEEAVSAPKPSAAAPVAVS